MCGNNVTVFCAVVLSTELTTDVPAFSFKITRASLCVCTVCHVFSVTGLQTSCVAYAGDADCEKFV